MWTPIPIETWARVGSTGVCTVSGPSACSPLGSVSASEGSLLARRCLPRLPGLSWNCSLKGRLVRRSRMRARGSGVLRSGVRALSRGTGSSKGWAVRARREISAEELQIRAGGLSGQWVLVLGRVML
jgi:hypothetical protein